MGGNRLTATAPGYAGAHPDREPPERRAGLLRSAARPLPLPGDRGRRRLQRAGDVLAALPVDRPGPARAAALRPRTTRPTTSRPRPPTRASRCRSSCAARTATRTATATRSSRCGSPGSRGGRGRRRSSGTASCSSPTAATAVRRTPPAPRRCRTTPARSSPCPLVTPSYVTALGRGFAVLSTALANTGHNCNVAMEAESLLMAKERLVERYGELRYTIGTGCSGGSIAQQHDRQRLPRHLPGAGHDLLLPGHAHRRRAVRRLPPDAALLRGPDPLGAGRRVDADPDGDGRGPPVPRERRRRRRGAVQGRPRPRERLPRHVDPVAGDESTRYDSETNPGGVRCSVLDIMGNLLGPRPTSVWGPEEQAAGRGFAGMPFANTGVQFGLTQLKQGLITPAQFVDLNVKLGGLDVDRQPTERADRRRPGGDPAGLPHRADQRDDQPRRGRDHQPRRPGPGHRARLRPRVLDRGAAARRPGPHRQPGDVVRPDAADRRPALGERGAARDGRLADGGRGRPPLRPAARPRSPRTGPPT